jgi:hypothetical protein
MMEMGLKEQVERLRTFLQQPLTPGADLPHEWEGALQVLFHCWKDFQLACQGCRVSLLFLQKCESSWWYRVAAR